MRRPTALQAGRPALEDDELLLALDAGGPAAAPASEDEGRLAATPASLRARRR
jgi:hypothetical protein